MSTEASVPSVTVAFEAEVVIVATANSLSCISMVTAFLLPLTLATSLSAATAVTITDSLPSAVVSFTTVIVAVAEEAPLAIVIALAFMVQSSPESAVESPLVF